MFYYFTFVDLVSLRSIFVKTLESLIFTCLNLELVEGGGENEFV